MTEDYIAHLKSSSLTGPLEVYRIVNILEKVTNLAVSLGLQDSISFPGGYKIMSWRPNMTGSPTSHHFVQVKYDHGLDQELIMWSIDPPPGSGLSLPSQQDFENLHEYIRMGWFESSISTMRKHI